ncbi:hypothetical protein [Streptomyces cuspidosporus]|uniref:Uncharacterized protein n=1 Tax=Streptomyces cuspidosporus TaxID=66882 RepID=A0ABN3GR25_9ACTN
MDPVLGGGLLMLCGWLCRLLHLWVSSRTELRRTEMQQQGLSERVRHLPPGSRLLERPGRVEVVTGTQPAELRRG